MSDDPSDDPRLAQAVKEYLGELEAGRRPDRDDFLRRHAELAGPLAACLDGLDLLHRGGGRDAEIDGRPLGDFKLLREIGRGGMGVIYEALQLSLGRRVALKVLPFAASLDPRQLQRFENEAKAAAQLHHPNIVPVHAVGCERGVRFYAMQLIEGQSLAELVVQLRAAPAGAAPSAFTTALSSQRAGRPGEFFHSIARLALQAAEGLDYAHQGGIVHRDVKPANLLVDAQGRLWITDFGLAQIHADAGLTKTGDLLGTLRYMSPEQAAGRRGAPDPRTDVYALGATLYELATLRPMFDGANREELLRQVLHDEPRAPRTVDPAVPPELETIVLKAVGKEPADRYGSAREMAADLERFLRDEPVLARRPSALERARKWARRHPSVVAATLALLLLAAAGLSVSNRLIREEQARTAARAAEAEEQFRLARQAVDELIEIADSELVDLPQMDGLRKRLLDSALAYYQAFVARRHDDPELEATRRRVELIVADLAALQGAGRHHLLNEPAVLDDLKVPAETRRRLGDLVQEIAARREGLFRDMGRISPEERSRRFLEQAKADDAAVAALLSPAQRERLRQIELQSEGPRAFRRPEVAAALKLTAEQRERLRTVEREPGRPGAPVPRFQAELTDAQKKAWKELIGEPFRGALPRRPNPGGPRGLNPEPPPPPGAPPPRDGPRRP